MPIRGSRIKISVAAVLALVLILSATAGVLPLSATSEEVKVHSGTWGGNIEWRFDTDTGVLSFTGSGKMSDTVYYADYPWHQFSSYVKTVSFGSEITEICKGVCDGFENLVNIDLAENGSLTVIGHSAFAACTSLKSVAIPSSVKVLDGSVFFGCRKLRTLTFGEGSLIESIGVTAFYMCDLKEPVLPNGLASIGDNAFAFNSGLGSVEIPSSVTSIGTSAFDFCADIVIQCHKDSAAHKFAEKNSIEVKLRHTFSSEVIAGDITHYRQCVECGQRRFEYEHEFVIISANDDGTHDLSCECGKLKTETCNILEASCIKRAVCDICNAEYGSFSDHSYSNDLTAGDKTHYYKCIECGEIKDETKHTFTFAGPNKDGTHRYVCECGKNINDTCSGGEATCTVRALCNICKSEYGGFAGHQFQFQTCNGAEHRRLCACGGSSEAEGHIFGEDGACVICTFAWVAVTIPDNEDESETESEGETEMSTDTEIETPSESREPESEEAVEDASAGEQSTGGCSSSVGGGAIFIISAAAVLGGMTVRNKKEN